jgi:hypothetical protein
MRALLADETIWASEFIGLFSMLCARPKGEQLPRSMKLPRPEDEARELQERTVN